MSVLLAVLLAMFASLSTGAPMPEGPCAAVFAPEVFVGLECGEAYAGLLWIDGAAALDVGP